MESVVQCLLLALPHKKHFLLSQRMRKEPAKGKPAPSWVTGLTEGSWTTKISRNLCFSCSWHCWLALLPVQPCSHQLAPWRAGPLMAILQHCPQGSYSLDKHQLQPANTELPTGLLSPLTATLPFESFALLFFYI